MLYNNSWEGNKSYQWVVDQIEKTVTLDIFEQLGK